MIDLTKYEHCEWWEDFIEECFVKSAKRYSRTQEKILNKYINKSKMKTSKVKAVQANGTYESNYGLLYKYEYTMEDGTILTANHKTEGGNFQVGETVEYEVKGTNDYGSWGKVSRPSEDNYQAKSNAPMSDERQYMIVLQSCLKASATYYAERTDGTPEVVMEQAKIWANEILKG